MTRGEFRKTLKEEYEGKSMEDGLKGFLLFDLK